MLGPKLPHKKHALHGGAEEHKGQEVRMLFCISGEEYVRRMFKRAEVGGAVKRVLDKLQLDMVQDHLRGTAGQPTKLQAFLPEHLAVSPTQAMVAPMFKWSIKGNVGHEEMVVEIVYQEAGKHVRPGKTKPETTYRAAGFLAYGSSDTLYFIALTPELRVPGPRHWDFREIRMELEPTSKGGSTMYRAHPYKWWRDTALTFLPTVIKMAASYALSTASHGAFDVPVSVIRETPTAKHFGQSAPLPSQDLNDFATHTVDTAWTMTFHAVYMGTSMVRIASHALGKAIKDAARGR